MFFGPAVRLYLTLYTSLDRADYFVSLGDIFHENYFKNEASKDKWQTYAKDNPNKIFIPDKKNPSLLVNFYGKKKETNIEDYYIRFHDFPDVLFEVLNKAIKFSDDAMMLMMMMMMMMNQRPTKKTTNKQKRPERATTATAETTETKADATNTRTPQCANNTLEICMEK